MISLIVNGISLLKGSVFDNYLISELTKYIYHSYKEVLIKDHPEFIKQLILEESTSQYSNKREFAKEVYDNYKEILIKDHPEFIKQLILDNRKKNDLLCIWFAKGIYRDHKETLIKDHPEFIKQLILGNKVRDFEGVALSKEIYRNHKDIFIKDYPEFIKQLIIDNSRAKFSDQQEFAKEIYDEHKQVFIKHYMDNGAYLNEARNLFKIVNLCNDVKLKSMLLQHHGEEVLITSATQHKESDHALIYLQGPDHQNAFATTLGQSLTNIVTPVNSDISGMVMILDDQYAYKDKVHSLVSAYTRHSNKVTLVLGMHGEKKESSPHTIAAYDTRTDQGTKPINYLTSFFIAELLETIGSKPVDIILVSCSGAWAAYDMKEILPKGSSFISAMDRTGSQKLFHALFNKMEENPHDHSYSLDHLLKVGLCTSTGSYHDPEHTMRMISSWGEVIELHKEAEYIREHGYKIFTPSLIEKLHSRFTEVESICGGVEATHNKLDKVIAQMSGNNMTEADLYGIFYGMIAVVEEVIQIYHEEGWLLHTESPTTVVYASEL